MQTGFMNGVDYMGGMWFFGPFMMLFWIALIVTLIVLLVRWLGGTPGGGQRSDSLDILKNRFARGEIDETEFENRKHQLGA